MTHYIDKSAVVAEIEKILADETESIKSFEHSKNVSEVSRSNARIGVLMHIRSLLDTIEVKEVDLEEEVKYILNQYYYFPEESIDIPTVIRITAKHFFGLGLKAQKGE
jgi:hypothetical protein